ncbi:MAG TPA: hypothetical protein VF460_04425 [Burkholderiales bacterium]
MNRRRFVAAMFAGLPLPALAHTPYRQWKVFRQRYLLITTSRTDPAGDALGDRFAEVLLAELPQSRAMVSRAINLERIASLITTDQANIAILDDASARALVRGDAPFADYGPFPLQAIVQTDTHRLICREDVPLHHGYMIAGALMDHAADLGIRIAAAEDAIPVHPGAAAYSRGEEIEAPQ